MYRHLSARRRRRAGLTTVEYALMLFLVGITAIYGIPSLAATVRGAATRTGDTIDSVRTGETPPPPAG